MQSNTLDSVSPPLSAPPAESDVRSADGAASASPPPIAPLSQSVIVSLYCALCRDCGQGGSEDGLQAFRDRLLQSCSTDCIALTSVGAGQATASLLSQLLTQATECARVQAVRLSGNRLRSYGLSQLLRAAQSRSNLRLLDVSDNAVGSAGAKEAAKVLVSNTAVSAVNSQHPAPAGSELCTELALYCTVLYCTVLYSAAAPRPRLALTQRLVCQPHLLAGRCAAGHEPVPERDAAVAEPEPQRHRQCGGLRGRLRCAAAAQRRPHSPRPAALQRQTATAAASLLPVSLLLRLCCAACCCSCLRPAAASSCALCRTTIASGTSISRSAHRPPEHRRLLLRADRRLLSACSRSSQDNGMDGRVAEPLQALLRRNSSLVSLDLHSQLACEAQRPGCPASACLSPPSLPCVWQTTASVTLRCVVWCPAVWLSTAWCGSSCPARS